MSLRFPASGISGLLINGALVFAYGGISQAPALPAVQINLVDVGFHDARLLASGDPDVLAAAFRDVRDVTMRGVVDASFWEIRDLA